MPHPSGQAGQEAGFSVNGDINNQFSVPHKQKRSGGNVKPPEQGKDRTREPEQDPKDVRELIAMVSHDLRTPLVSIYGTLALLRVGACGELPAKALEAIQVAERGSTRLIKLINDLLDIEQLESGKPPITMSACCSSTIVLKAVESVVGFAQQHSITIESPQQHFMLNADEDRLVQVMVNLLSNAIKFSPSGSTVTIELADEEEGVVFRVVDRGTGIEQERGKKLFERFCPSQASSSAKLNGNGLGLSICRAIVRGHNGAIGFTSQLGAGSTFWFQIPR